MSNHLYTCERIGLPNTVVRASAKAGPSFGSQVPDTMTKLLGFDPKALVARTLRPAPVPAPQFEKNDPKKHTAYMREWRAKNPERNRQYSRRNKLNNLAKGLTTQGKPRKRPYRPRQKRSLTCELFQHDYVRTPR
jgi:hypothetical protein